MADQKSEIRYLTAPSIDTKKKKYCRFKKSGIKYIDYKDPEFLKKFLWMNDLSTFDPIIEWNTNIWLIGDHLSLTCILFCVANLLYSWMTMRQQRDQMVGQQAEQMKMMDASRRRYIMSIWSLVFVIRLPLHRFLPRKRLLRCCVLR